MKQTLKREDRTAYHFLNGLKISGYPSDLYGDVTGLYGDVTGLRGDVTGLYGDVDECEISEAEHKAVVFIDHLIEQDKPNDQSR